MFLPKKTACVVVPTYNESENLRILLAAIFDQAPCITEYELHVVVVDDESPDATAEVVRKEMPFRPRLHLLSAPKRGLGDAYKRGFTYCLSELKASLLIQMDADLQHDPSLLPKLVASCTANHIVVGSRFASGARTPGLSNARRMISRAASGLLSIHPELSTVSDCTSGYRCFDAALVSVSNFHRFSSGYAFQSELLRACLRNGAKVVELPITFHARVRGSSKLSLHDCIAFLHSSLKRNLM
jgi:dolichol-phosphate mannosyltransferase